MTIVLTAVMTVVVTAVVTGATKAQRKEAMDMRGTTILGVRAGGKAAIGGDGQVTLVATMVKQNANKIPELADGRGFAGFAGRTDDPVTVVEKLEDKL